MALACIAFLGGPQAPAAGAEEEGREAQTFELSPAARQILARLQESWLDWLAAYYQGDESRSASSIEDLLSDARLLGTRHLPELSVGAATRATEFARSGDLARAGQGLEAAARFDPERREIARASSTVSRLAGSYPKAAANGLRGYLLSWREPTVRFLRLANLSLWLLSTLLVAGVGFVCLQFAVNGRLLLGDLVRFLGRLLPQPLAWALALAVVLWPILLPSSLIWLAVYWSLLVWGYASRGARGLLALLWLTLLLLPATLMGIGRGASLRLAPPLRALASADSGRLTGTLYADLAELPAILPESLAVKHLQADLYRSLGQCERAQALYQAVLEAEPENESALVDHGVCLFRDGDNSRAMDRFSAAASLPQPSAAGYFNLSQAYSELYRFAESEEALGEARRLGREEIAVWIERAEEERVVALSGGLRRGAEISRQLEESWSRGERRSGRRLMGAAMRSLPSLLAFVAIALAVAVVRRRLPKGAATSGSRAGGLWSRIRRALVPGLGEAEDGRWLAAYVALLAVALLLTLPLMSGLGFEFLAALPGGESTLWGILFVGLGIYMAIRLAGEVMDS